MAFFTVTSLGGKRVIINFVNKTNKHMHDGAVFGVCVKGEMVRAGKTFCAEIFILSSLPKSVSSFVKDHELYHALHFDERPVFWQEIKASIYAGVRHPFGCVRCVLMSFFSLKRWRFYFNRLTAKLGGEMT